jgi:hypothetical protein
MNSTAVALFGYNRPGHIKNCLEGLVSNKDFSLFPIYIFLDGMKPGESEIKHLSVAKVCEAFSKKFSNITVIQSYENLGLRKSIISNLDNLFKEYSKVITLEDDLLISEDFLIYMNQALLQFQSDALIGSISGFREGFFPPYLKSDLVAANRHCCWGWATWRDRWEKVNWHMPALGSPDFERDLGLLSGIGADLGHMYALQANGLIDSWSITFDANAAKYKWRCIQPRRNLVSNAGLDGTGTHFTSPVTLVSDIKYPKGTLTVRMRSYSISTVYDSVLKFSRSKLIRISRRIVHGITTKVQRISRNSSI